MTPQPSKLQQLQNVDTCLFDLDDTLYPRSCGIAAACADNIRDFMVTKLGFSQQTVDAENQRLYRAHGTSMAGLRAEGFAFSFDDFHNFVHAPLPYHVLRPDPILRKMLHSMPQRKFIFTNSDRGHAARCLSRLAVEDCLHGVIAFEDIMEAPPVRAYSMRNQTEEEVEEEERGERCRRAEGASEEDGIAESWVGPGGPLVCCKPQIEAFRRALVLAQADPHTTVMFDDNASNLVGAKKAGLHTVLVGTSTTASYADFSVASIHNVHEAIPQLWANVELKPEATCPCGQEPPRVQVQA